MLLNEREYLACWRSVISSRTFRATEGAEAANGRPDHPSVTSLLIHQPDHLIKDPLDLITENDHTSNGIFLSLVNRFVAPNGSKEAKIKALMLKRLMMVKQDSFRMKTPT